MKKSARKQKTQARRKQASAQQAPEARGELDRRALFRKARNWTIGLAVVGGSGFLLVENVLGTIREHDLSQVGNGRPTIVQIHDPQCPTCMALQREARSALKHFDSDDLNYVVANIRSQEGVRFANRYGVRHVTLLLFDGDGELKDILHGPRDSNSLQTAFASLL